MRNHYEFLLFLLFSHHTPFLSHSLTTSVHHSPLILSHIFKQVGKPKRRSLIFNVNGPQEISTPCPNIDTSVLPCFVNEVVYKLVSTGSEFDQSETENSAPII